MLNLAKPIHLNSNKQDLSKLRQEIISLLGVTKRLFEIAFGAICEHRAAVAAEVEPHYESFYELKRRVQKISSQLAEIQDVEMNTFSELEKAGTLLRLSKQIKHEVDLLFRIGVSLADCPESPFTSLIEPVGELCYKLIHSATTYYVDEKCPPATQEKYNRDEFTEIADASIAGLRRQVNKSPSNGDIILNLGITLRSLKSIGHYTQEADKDIRDYSRINA